MSKIKKALPMVEKLYAEKMLIRDIVKKTGIKYGTIGYMISAYGLNKKYPRKNPTLFSSTRQFENRNKFTSEQSRKIVLKMWGEIRNGTRIVKRSKKDGIINSSWYGTKENHWNWKGGISTLVELIRNLPEDREWHNLVFKRDNYTCQDCKKRGVELNAHHKKAFINILRSFLNKYNQFSPIEDKYILTRLAITYKPFWDIDNGETLCEECHGKYSTRP